MSVIMTSMLISGITFESDCPIILTCFKAFTEWVADHVEIRHGTGVDAIADVYAELLENRTRPDTAHVLHP